MKNTVKDNNSQINKFQVTKMKSYLMSIFLLAIPVICTFQIAEANQEKEKVGIEEHLGQYLPMDLKFANANGDSVTLNQVITEPTIISMVYYHCPGICFPLLGGLKDAIDAIEMQPGKDFKILTVSFDHNEQYTKAAEWKTKHLQQLKRQIPEDSWNFLTGDSLAVRKLTDALGFYFKPDGTGEFIHAGALFVVSPKGMISRYIFYDNKPFNQFDMKMALIEANEGRSNPTINKVLQFCFSYDPDEKTYVINLTRIIGAAMLLSVAVFASVLIIKTKKKNSNIDGAV